MVIQHINLAHSGFKRFKCPYLNCLKSFAYNSTLKDHINAHHTNNTPFKCPTCQQKFPYRQLLRIHYANKHGERITECPKCGMHFRTEWLLEGHLAGEHGEGITFWCNLCPKILSSKQWLQRHRDVAHLGLKPFKCPFPGCSMAFTYPVARQRHTYGEHYGPKLFKCPYPHCLWACTEKQTLEQHTNEMHTV